jgi:hypothetical protein
MFALLIGTQLPDLIDKPLAFWFAIFPEGRALAHSLLFAVPLWVCVLLVGYRKGRTDVAFAFVLGYAAHLPADAANAIIRGDYAALSYVLWPILPVRTYETNSFEGHLLKLLENVQSLTVETLVSEPFAPFALQVWLVGLVMFIWIVDGFPGLRLFFRALVKPP